MKTLQAILNEYGEQLYEEIEDLFENETDEIELRFQFDAEGFIDVQAFRKSVEEIDLNDDKPEFSFKLEGLKD